MKKKKSRLMGRRLGLEPLEDRRLLSATWYTFSTDMASVDANALEMWDRINQFRTDPVGMLYRIFDNPQNLYEFENFNASDPGTVRAAKDLEVDSAIKSWLTDENGNFLEGDALKAAVDQFLNEWYSLESVAPLALSSALSTVAKNYNDAMKLENNGASHRSEEDLLAQITNAGFTLAEGSVPAENISYAGKSEHSDSGYTFSPVSYLFSSFAIDWGVGDLAHRQNMLSTDATEIGINVQYVTNHTLAPWFTTVDFAQSATGARTDGAYLSGLIYSDGDGDGFYTAEEGLAWAGKITGYKITIEALDGDNVGKTVVIDTTSNGFSAYGAYQIFLENGSYNVTISGGAKIGGGTYFGDGFTQKITIADGTNVKADFRYQDISLGTPTLDLDSDEEGTGTEAVFSEAAAEAVALVQGNYAFTGIETLTRMSILFDVRPDGANEMLQVTIPENSSLIVSKNTVTGGIDIFGSAGIDVYGEILASLSYINLTEGYADLTARYITVSVSNGLYWSNPAMITLSITPTILPELTVSDAEVWEWETGSDAASGQKTLVFHVTLSMPARFDVSFDYTVIDGTALAGTNYSPTDECGSIALKTGESVAEIRVTVYGDYEINADLTLSLRLENIENADWTDRVIVGTIKDDDTPVASLADVDSYTGDVSYSFERGERRFLYSYTTDNEGLVKFSAVGNNMTLSVYNAWLPDAEVVTTSKWVDGRETVEWYAEKGTVYYIKLEGLYTFRNVSLSLMALDTDSAVSVDPLLDSDGRLAVSLDDDRLQIGTGANQWTLPYSVLGQLNSLALTASRPGAIFDLSYGDGAALTFDAGANRLNMGDFSFDLVGFAGYSLNGSNSRETLDVTGSDGNDLLVYDGSSGTLTLGYDSSDDPVAAPVTYSFTDITNLNFDGGGGTGDVAQIRDSASNDTVVCQSDGLTMTGGGHALTLVNFNDVSLTARSGGVNALSVSSTDWENMLLLTGTVRYTGTDDDAPFTLYATGLNSILVDASDSNGKVTLYGINDGDLNYWATLGYLKAQNTKTGLSVEVVSAKDLELEGVDESRQDQVTLVEADVDEFSRQEEQDKQVYTGIDAYLTQLKLTLPVWATSLKNKDDGQSAALTPTAENAAAIETPVDSPVEAVLAIEPETVLCVSGQNALDGQETAVDTLLEVWIAPDAADLDFSDDEDVTQSSPVVTDTALAQIPEDVVNWWMNETSAYRRKKYAVIF